MLTLFNLPLTHLKLTVLFRVPAPPLSVVCLKLVMTLQVLLVLAQMLIFLTLTDQVLTVAGGVKGTTLSGSSTLDVAGVSRFGPENKTTISTAGVISGSGISTLYSVTSDAIIAQTADINGGTVDGTTIGGNTAAAGTFTNISGSGTLQALGVVTLGNGKTSVSVEGVLSSSAISTFDEMTMDRASIGAFSW